MVCILFGVIEISRFIEFSNLKLKKSQVKVLVLKIDLRREKQKLFCELQTK